MPIARTPKERFGSASAIHAYFLEWERTGFFEALWEAGLAEYDDLQGIAWRWQRIDGATMKAPLAQEGVGPNPTDRGGGNGSKRYPEKPAWRWIVEVAHSWFNRFRKLLVRYEKFDRSFLALHHLAAAIIVFRKVPMTVNIIYG